MFRCAVEGCTAEPTRGRGQLVGHVRREHPEVVSPVSVIVRVEDDPAPDDD